VFDRYLLIVMPHEVLRFDLDLFRARRVKDLWRGVSWDSEPTHLMPDRESEELEATLPAVGVAVDYITVRDSAAFRVARSERERRACEPC